LSTGNEKLRYVTLGRVAHSQQEIRKEICSASEKNKHEKERDDFYGSKDAKGRNNKGLVEHDKWGRRD